VRMYVLWGGWGCASGYSGNACVGFTKIVRVSGSCIGGRDFEIVQLAGLFVREAGLSGAFPRRTRYGANALTRCQALDKTSLATAPDDVPV
jgi:hypothetical protein